MKNIMYILGSIILVLVGLLFFALGKESKAPKEEELTEIITSEKSEAAFTIDDRTEICAQALELIYSDDENSYYLSCIKSGTIYLVYTDGTEITLKDALEQNAVTMDELMKAGLSVIIEPTGNLDSSSSSNKTTRASRTTKRAM